jgi:hypothetical protein
MLKHLVHQKIVVTWLTPYSLKVKAYLINLNNNKMQSLF